jgi:hypothetical protein
MAKPQRSVSRGFAGRDDRRTYVHQEIACQREKNSSLGTAQGDEKVPPACSRTEKEWTMIFKIIAFVTAAIPIFLFVRSIFFRRPTRLNEGFKEFKKQSDVAVSIFLLLIGCVVIFAVGKLVWAWL